MQSPCNLTELKQFCKEEWANIAQSRGAKLLEIYSKRLLAIIQAKGDPTKYLLRGCSLIQIGYFTVLLVIHFRSYIFFYFTWILCVYCV